MIPHSYPYIEIEVVVRKTGITGQASCRNENFLMKNKLYILDFAAKLARLGNWGKQELLVRTLITFLMK